MGNCTLWCILNNTRMTQIFVILVLSFLTGFSSCDNKKTENNNSDLKAAQVDYSKIAILPFDSTQYWDFKSCERAKLNSSDMIKIENLLKGCIDIYNKGLELEYNQFKSKNKNAPIDRNDFIIDLSKYRRQYVAVTNNKGEKVVWINCFCVAHGIKWKKEVIFVLDGGNCYFNLKINLAKRECYELMVNGEA